MKFSGIQSYTLLDYPDRVAAVLFTPGCNMRCKFCHNKEFVEPREIAKIASSFIEEDAVLSFLQKRVGLLDGVVISGGEPTMQIGLRSFVEKVKKMGFLVKLDTNGSHPEVVRELCEHKLIDYVAMDIKTSWEGYEDLVGMSNYEKQLEENISYLKMDHIPYEFRTTLIDEVHTEIILYKMRKIVKGAQMYSLQNFRSANTLDPAFAKYHGITPEKMSRIASFFAPVVETVNVR